MEQNIISLSVRVCKIETNAASAPRVSGSARSWPLPTAPQPQGPMIQGLLKRAGTQDADSILFRVQMMKMLEVPLSYEFFANNAMQVCLLGLMKSYLQQPTCPQPICPSEFTAKQEPLPVDTYVAREVDVKNFWQHTETTFSFDNPSHMRTEKSDDDLHRSGRPWFKNYVVPALDIRTQKWSWKTGL